MKSLCVFMGANFGKSPAYLKAATLLGMEIAKRKLHLIYGGSHLGLMGELANTVLYNGGMVTGVIPQVLYQQEAHLGLSKLHIVDTMQERKSLMGKLSEGFIILPGGLGTLEEFCEFWNASKIGIHKKPLALLNTENYFNKFLEFIDHSIEEKFLQPEHRTLINVSDDPGTLLDAMLA